jgi:asparagine synthase (glutamine-hydrolysing)
MCGICGYHLDSRNGKIPDLASMMLAMAHRGPDGEGIHQTADVGLGHRRLSIIDLECGAQPMYSPDGRIALIYNGEIYNYMELRRDLEARGRIFATSSDTEVLLAMYEAHGPAMLEYLNGMFAFAVHDMERDLLFAARDRLGIKPFYFVYQDGEFIFASEIKALLASGRVRPVPDPLAVQIYLARRYVPGQRTCFSGVRKLPPGHSLLVRRGCQPELRRYWQPPEPDASMTLEDVAQVLGELLHSAVAYRLISDVPVGLLLSGGIDSAVIAAAMFGQGHPNLASFSIGFGTDTDETGAALQVARHFDFRPEVGTVAPQETERFTELVRLMDEPYGDPILLPLYLLCRMAAKRVKVVLSGDGADETQCGYVHHEAMARLAQAGRKALGRTGLRFAALASPLVGHIPVSLLDRFFHYPASMGTLGRARLASLAENATSPSAVLRSFADLFTPGERLELCGPRLQDAFAEAEEEWFTLEARNLDSAEDPLEALRRHELAHWLPDNILNKFDRMSMGNSIENRVPFLDHRLVEVLMRLPADRCLRQGRGKAPLRAHAQMTLNVPEGRSWAKQAFYYPLIGPHSVAMEKLADRWLAPAVIDDNVLNRGAIARVRLRARSSPLLGGKQVFALVALQLWQHAFGVEW